MDQPYERLRHARKAAGFKSASAAARAFGWNEAAYRHHENGTRGYGVEQAAVYGEAFTVSPSWLLTLGFATGPSWRLPIGRFFTENLYPALSWKPGLEEAVNEAADALGYFYVPHLDVGIDTVDVIKREDGFPSFHFIDPVLVGVERERFEAGFMFLMNSPRATAWSAVEEGDLLLVDSGQAEIRRTPELWVIRSGNEIVAGYAQRTPNGVRVFLPEGIGFKPQPIEAEANIVGQVRWSARRHK